MVMYIYIHVLASAGNQCGTPVFFLADAPARYNAWDEFVLYSFYRLIAPSGNEFGAPVSFFAMRRRRIMYNAWDEFVFNRSIGYLMWYFSFFNFVLCVTPLCESNWGSGLLSLKAASCEICFQGRGQTVGATVNCQVRMPGT